MVHTRQVSTQIWVNKQKSHDGIDPKVSDHFDMPLAIAPQAKLEEVRFRGSPRFYSNGSSWREPADPNSPWPENREYFGQPSREIDEAWDDLIGWRYFSISEEEAKRAWGEKYKEYRDPRTGGFGAG
jgi:hypothetical protein